MKFDDIESWSIETIEGLLKNELPDVDRIILEARLEVLKEIRDGVH